MKFRVEVIWVDDEGAEQPDTTRGTPVLQTRTKVLKSFGDGTHCSGLQIKLLYPRLLLLTRNGEKTTRRHLHVKSSTLIKGFQD